MLSQHQILKGQQCRYYFTSWDPIRLQRVGSRQRFRNTELFQKLNRGDERKWTLLRNRTQTYLVRLTKQSADIFLYSCPNRVTTFLLHPSPTTSTYQGFKIWSREGEIKNETPLWPHLELSPFAILFSITVPTWKCSRSTEVLEREPRVWTSWISRHIRECLKGQPARQAQLRSRLGGACASDDFLALCPCQWNYTVLMQVLTCPFVSVLNARFTKVFKKAHFVSIDPN